MPFLTCFATGVTRLNDRIGRLAALLILPIFAVLLLEVGLRYLAGSPTVWTNELAQMLFGAYALLSGGYLVAQNGHANVDILHNLLRPRTRAVLDILTSALMFLFIGALLYYGGSMAWESVSRFEHTMSAWNPPAWPLKSLIPIAAGLILLQGLVKLIGDVRVALGHTDPAASVSSSPASEGTP